MECLGFFGMFQLVHPLLTMQSILLKKCEKEVRFFVFPISVVPSKQNPSCSIVGVTPLNVLDDESKYMFSNPSKKRSFGVKDDILYFK